MKNNHVKNMARCLAATGLVCGLISLASAAPVLEIEPNDSRATAQNIDSFFDLSFDVNIENSAGVNTSTTITHAEVQGLRSNTASWDYYAFRVTNRGTAIFDIDCGLTTFGGCVSNGSIDAWLNLFDSAGGLIMHSDDIFLSVDTGSRSRGSRDSFIQTTLNAGIYTIAVGSFRNSPVVAGGDYVLNVSIENHALTQGNAVPEPAPLALLGLGLLGLGLARRRKSA